MPSIFLCGIAYCYLLKILLIGIVLLPNGLTDIVLETFVMVCNVILNNPIPWM